jgi:hypothetical protein
MKFQKFRPSAELLGAICGGLLISLPAIPQVLAQESTPKVNPCPSIFYEEPHNSQVVVPQGCPPNALTQRLAAQGLLPVPTTPSQEQVRLGVGGEADPANISSTVNPSIFSEPSYNRSQPPVAPQPGVRLPRPVPPAVGQVSPVPPQPVPGEQTQQPSLLEPRQTPIATIALNNGTVNVKLMNYTAANVTFQVIGDTAPRSLQGKSDVTLQGLKAPVTVTFEREDGGQLIVTPQASLEPGSLEVTFKEATNAAQGRSAMRIERNGSVFLN